jgi:hypothetical protein
MSNPTKKRKEDDIEFDVRYNEERAFEKLEKVCNNAKRMAVYFKAVQTFLRENPRDPHSVLTCTTTEYGFSSMIQAIQTAMEDPITDGIDEKILRMIFLGGGVNFGGDGKLGGDGNLGVMAAVLDRFTCTEEFKESLELMRSYISTERRAACARLVASIINQPVSKKLCLAKETE